MRNAAKALIPLLVLTACGGGGEGTNQAENRAAAPTDIDVLPADESVATDSSELAAGVNDPELDNTGANELGNGY